LPWATVAQAHQLCVSLAQDVAQLTVRGPVRRLAGSSKSVDVRSPPRWAALYEQ
jgi:hypothetical protein